MRRAADDGAATGEEHAVDLARLNAFGREHFVHGFFDPLDVVRDPPFEVRARNFLLNVDVTELQHKIGALRRRQLHLVSDTAR